MNRKEIERFVDQLPANGEWWDPGNRDSLIAALEILLRFNVDAEEAKRVVWMVYRATKAEYGE